MVKNHGFCQSQANHTMFYKHSINGKVTILIVCGCIIGDDYAEIADLKRKLANEFEIKDL